MSNTRNSTNGNTNSSPSSYEVHTGNLGDVAVIGGGLGGLTAALYLAQAGHSVTIFDSRPSLGGRARTDERRGFLFNQGPHALYLAGEAHATLADLGIKPRGGNPGTNGTVLRNGRVHVGPADVKTLLSTSALGFKEKLDFGRLLARLPKLDGTRYRNLTVNEWLDDNLRTEGARLLTEALVRLTTYANQPDQLSADVAISQIQMGLGVGVLYLDDGWQQLVDALADRLRANPKVEFRLGQRLTELPDTRVVVVATGDPVSTGKLVGTRFAADAETGTLGHPGVGPAARAACLDLGTSEPPNQDLILGMDEPFYLSNHSTGGRLAPEGMWHVAAVSYLGAGDVGDRDELTRLASLGWGGETDLERVTVESRYLHDMTTAAAIPVAGGGGMAGRPDSSATGHDNVFIVGDWVGPRGHLADASMASARNAADAVARHLDSALVAR